MTRLHTKQTDKKKERAEKQKYVHQKTNQTWIAQEKNSLYFLQAKPFEYEQFMWLSVLNDEFDVCLVVIFYIFQDFTVLHHKIHPDQFVRYEICL